VRGGWFVASQAYGSAVHIKDRQCWEERRLEPAR
jgi:hypothetical protein